MAPPTFPILTSLPAPGQLPGQSPFTVSFSRGFLPLSDPPTTLPSPFSPVSSLLERMPIRTASGAPGLLATFTFGETLLKELPDLTEVVEEYMSDANIMCALYRDYCFLASAYLLEPCHERFAKGEGYGLGRQRLPACVARVLAKVAEM